MVLIVQADPHDSMTGARRIENFSWVKPMLINLNRHVVKFCDGLYLDVFAPNSLLSVIVNVGFERGKSLTINEALEVAPL